MMLGIDIGVTGCRGGGVGEELRFTVQFPLDDPDNAETAADGEYVAAFAGSPSNTASTL